jgi:flavin reductase (DIM6/NTAB) family NADH-FMN oxidoreductase RutF
MRTRPDADGGLATPIIDPTPKHRVIRPKILYVGTPVFLVSTENPDGSFNLAPASSYWALGQMLVLGLETEGQSAQNLLERRGFTVSFPSPSHWRAVERLAALTARHPVPPGKADRYRHEPEKFGAAGLHAEASDLVAPPRVRESSLQFEAEVRRATLGVGDDYLLVEAEVLRVHAAPEIVTDGEHIDPRTWQPLIYSFKHYFGLGDEVGWTRSSPTAPATAVTDAAAPPATAGGTP